MKYSVLIGRILFSSIFIMAASGHFKPETIAYAASQGVPFASFLVPVSGLLALAGGLSVVTGYKAKAGAWILILFLLPVTFAMHAFWNVTDPMARQVAMVFFMKNISILGGTFFLTYFGAGPLSIDSWLKSKERNVKQTMKVTKPSYQPAEV